MVENGYIDKKKILEALRECKNTGIKSNYSAECVADAMIDTVMDTEPESCAIPTVYCKDCMQHSDGEDGNIYCKWFAGCRVRPYAYCAFGFDGYEEEDEDYDER